MYKLLHKLPKDLNSPNWVQVYPCASSSFENWKFGKYARMLNKTVNIKFSIETLLYSIS